VVPQNRVRPRRQQIVYYWRNDTNTQLNPIQPHKTQCFTLTLVSLKSALALTLTVALSSSLSAHTCTVSALSIPLSFLYVYMRKESINIVAEKERVVDGGEGG
jgi:hypothetical protein